MIVLNLKKGDYVTIGDNIKVYYEHEVSRDSIKIDAPRDIKILRAKHYEANMADKEKAPAGGMNDASHNTF